MVARRLRGVAGTVLAGLLAAGLAAHAQEKGKDKDKPDTDKIPKKVMDALKAKFPKAEIVMWTMEKEGDKEVYDIEFKQDGKKFEADIFADGTIHNWEKEIAAKDLPKAVREAVDKRYPKATVKEVMEVTEVKDGKDRLEGYEVVLETEVKKEVELMVAPDGKILEDSGENTAGKEEKKDEKKKDK